MIHLYPEPPRQGTLFDVDRRDAEPPDTRRRRHNRERARRFRRRHGAFGFAGVEPERCGEDHARDQ